MFRRKSLSIVCVIFILFTALVATLFLGFDTFQQKASADSEDINQICKYFTDSDKLVTSDGELSNFNIRNFKDELQKVGMNLDKEMPELAQIIPAQFLQREETDKV